MRVLVLLAVVACGSAKPAKPDIDATRAGETLKRYAERCLACNNDKDCVTAIRDEYDPYKRPLFKSRESYTAAEQQAFDYHFGQLALCGDAAGVTIWKN